MKDFEQLSHTADLKIRIYGKTLNELFRNGVVGMFQVIQPRAKGCTYQNDRLVCPELPQVRTIELGSKDPNSLLVDFLSDAIYLSDVYNEAYLDADVEVIENNFVKATLRGITIEGFEVVEIKAVTYHSLNIEQKDGIWQTDIVFDI